jgi:hypothetical protein
MNGESGAFVLQGQGAVLNTEPLGTARLNDPAELTGFSFTRRVFLRLSDPREIL